MNSELTLVQWAQMAAIFNPDPLTRFKTLISNSDEKRSEATVNFIVSKQTDPNTVALKLAQLLRFTPRVEGMNIASNDRGFL